MSDEPATTRTASGGIPALGTILVIAGTAAGIIAGFIAKTRQTGVEPFTGDPVYGFDWLLCGVLAGPIVAAGFIVLAIGAAVEALK